MGVICLKENHPLCENICLLNEGIPTLIFSIRLKLYSNTSHCIYYYEGKNRNKNHRQQQSTL